MKLSMFQILIKCLFWGENMQLLYEKDGIEYYVDMINVEDVIKNPLNPNVMNDKMFNKLLESMDKYGFIQLIIVAPAEDVEEGLEGKWYLLDGHHRYDAAVLRGEKQIPAIIVKGLSAVAIKNAVINFNTIRGDIDPQRLALALKKFINEFGEETVRKWSMLDKEEIDRVIGRTEKSAEEIVRNSMKELEQKMEKVKQFKEKQPKKLQNKKLIDLTDIDKPLKELRMFFTEEDYEIVTDVLRMFSNDWSDALKKLCLAYKKFMNGEAG